MAGDNAQADAFAKGKDFLVLIPLLGATLAVIYDVGFFVGLNVDYFTFFTLNEHIVFALEVLPFGLAFALLVITMVYILRPTVRGPRKSVNLPIQISIVLVTTIVGSILIRPILLPIGAGLITFFCVLLANSETFRERLIIACVTAAVIAFYFGYLVAAPVDRTDGLLKYLGVFKAHYTTIIDTKNNGALEARLIRSGDRGVLFLTSKITG